MKVFNKFICFVFAGLFVLNVSVAQKNDTTTTNLKYKLVSAGPQYKRSKWHNFFWGRNYRNEWSTPMNLPVFLLAERKGGLTPEKEGGGHQTTSLHLEDKNGKKYSLRSVDKRLGKVLPKSFLGTFIERQVNDEVSMSHPYAAVTVPGMAQSAGIYHTNPEYVYLPRQEALDTFNNKFGNKVYLFEERVKGDWEDADNLGNFEKFYSTDEVMERLQKETENKVDQFAFAKARLFDMLIGDWDRHEEQWEWGKVKKGKENIFVPVPVDRDQVYFKHNGVALDGAIYISGIDYFQSFKDHISNVNTMNYEERGLDRVFTNELTKEQWQAAAKELQEALTDNVIESSVKKMPAKAFAISGNQIIRDLKSRRNDLIKYATTYYLFLSKQVEIIGTTGTDYFAVNRLNNTETEVKVFNITKEGTKENTPYYSRLFLNNETEELRLFGLSGNDVFVTTGKVHSGIKIKFIGGYDKDSILINSLAGNRTKTYVYDGHDDYIQKAGRVTEHLSNDSAIHQYQYRSFLYDKKGTFANIFYSDADRLFVGFGYGWQHFHWRKPPYVFKQFANVHYSISQKALSFTYAGIFPNFIGKTNLALLANYDFVRWTNFYGLGNESLYTTTDKDYNRMRTREGFGSIGLNRKAGNNIFSLSGFFQNVKIINDEERYVAKSISPGDNNVFNSKTYAGVIAGYGFSKLNDLVVPTSGVQFSATASYTQNVKESKRYFWRYGGNLQLYVPLVSKFSLAISGGVQTVDGTPEFYQYPVIGGGQNLRGFQLQRFYGKTAFYNSNELRFISKIRSYLLNGKAGFVGFVDDGRVWMPGEKSNTLHVGYGGGIIVVPFNLIFLDITYGFSNEPAILQFRLNISL